MTGSEDAEAPHAAAEQDSRDPSRAANQIRAEPTPPSEADEEMPAADSDQPDAPVGTRDGTAADRDPDRPQAGVPESTVTDPTPTLGTSEEMEPVQGVHTPDVGPGGDQIDTEDHAHRGRAAGTA